MSKFNFSTPSTLPNTGLNFGGTPFGAAAAGNQTQTGLTFGTPTTAAPAFGATAPSFGQTVGGAAPAFGATVPAPAFGAAVPATSFGNVVAGPAPTFGTNTAAVPNFGATAAPAFGATAAPAFGATAPAFGSTAAPAFGATGAPAFGATAAPAFGGMATSMAPAFGSGTTALPTLGSIGQAAITTTTPMFGGATAASIPNTGLTLGGGSIVTSQATAPLGGFNFSAAPAPSSTGLTFSTNTSTAVPTFSSGLFGVKTTASAFPTLGTAPAFGATTSNIGLGSMLGTAATAPTTTSAVPKLGLGGVDLNASQPKTTEGRSESGRIKEAQLPQEIITNVHALQQHIDQQKSISSDISRKSKNICDELKTLNWSLAEISNCVENNFAAVKSLRAETGEAVRQAEMAQRTQQTPAGLQFENTAPLQYFMELIQKYEADMITFRNQVELTEKHMRSLANPQNFTADDLKLGLRQIHESFIALAGRLHETHQKVELQKEQYLNLRKHLLKDNTNVFVDEEEPANKSNAITYGPSPFSTQMNFNMSILNRNSSASWPMNVSQQKQAEAPIFGLPQQQQQPFSFSGMDSAGGVGTQFNGGSGSGGIGSFGLAATNFAGGSIGDGSFNLQKPPVGIKRNKQ